MTAERICLAGATGYLGSRVAAAFRSRGYPLTAIVRKLPESGEGIQLLAIGANVIGVDAARREPYDDALTGVDIAISCMASRNVYADAASDFWAIDRDANVRFGLAAIAAGAHRIILVATYEGVASRRFTAFSDAKEQAVDALAAASRLAGVSFAVIRPTAYFSDLTDRAFNSVAAHNRYVEIGDGSHRINPVDGNDVASFIADHAVKSGRPHEDCPVGGPEIFTFREIGELAASVLGTRASLRIRSFPVGAIHVIATLASAAGYYSPKMRRASAVMRWITYAGTHDAVAPSCGPTRLRDVFASKAIQLRRRE